jgi:hypothetical protein
MLLAGNRVDCCANSAAWLDLSLLLLLAPGHLLLALNWLLLLLNGPGLAAAAAAAGLVVAAAAAAGPGLLLPDPEGLCCWPWFCCSGSGLACLTPVNYADPELCCCWL